MHWVERGPEPEGLKEIRGIYTQRWIDYYRHGKGKKPNDSRWSDFHDNLCRVFWGICAYCERRNKGEVEHFRPKSKFPELVYEWSNWLFACHDCNQAKGAKWPEEGYVDPCADSKSERPENYFTFNITEKPIGTMLPRKELSERQGQKAERMIHDLDLNARRHLRARRDLIELIRAILEKQLPYVPERVATILRGWLRNMTSRQSELSSVSRAVLLSEGFSQLIVD